MKVGDVYSTRDGRKAKVLSIQYGVAKIEVTLPPEIQSVWEDSGRGNQLPQYNHPYDLILPKTIKAQRVIEYEGSEKWVTGQLENTNNVCGPDKDFVTASGSIIREVSRKFL